MPSKTKSKKKHRKQTTRKRKESALNYAEDNSVVFCHKGVCLKKSKYGTGTFSTKRIPKNVIILRETPHALNHPRDSEYIFKFIRKLLDNPETKSKFESLVPLTQDEFTTPYNEIEEGHRKYLSDLTPEQMRLMHEKMTRNWFSLGEKPGILFTGTRMNHSCNPNVNYSMDGDHMVFRTTRPIQKNEELFDSYINTQLPYEERQRKLQHRYGFKCACEKCKKESDAFNERMGDVKEKSYINSPIYTS